MSLNRNYFQYLTGKKEIPEREKTKDWQRRKVRANILVACWSCGKPLKRDNQQHLCAECAVEQ